MQHHSQLVAAGFAHTAIMGLDAMWSSAFITDDDGQDVPLTRMPLHPVRDSWEIVRRTQQINYTHSVANRSMLEG